MTPAMGMPCDGVERSGSPGGVLRQTSPPPLGLRPARPQVRRLPIPISLVVQRDVIAEVVVQGLRRFQ